VIRNQIQLSVYIQLELRSDYRDRKKDNKANNRSSYIEQIMSVAAMLIVTVSRDGSGSCWYYE